MTSELCQDVVAASEKSSNRSLTSEKAAWEALRAGEGGGGGEEKKGDTLLSHPELYNNP